MCMVMVVTMVVIVCKFGNEGLTPYPNCESRIRLRLARHCWDHAQDGRVRESRPLSWGQLRLKSDCKIITQL